jgi:hypothetical protein
MTLHLMNYKAMQFDPRARTLLISRVLSAGLPLNTLSSSLQWGHVYRVSAHSAPPQHATRIALLRVALASYTSLRYQRVSHG